MTSPAAVDRMIRRRLPSRPRLGVVSAVTSSTVAVRFQDGTTTTHLVWAHGYVPTVGDQVSVVPHDGGAWVVQGAVTATPTLIPDEQIKVAPTRLWVRGDDSQTQGEAPWLFPWETYGDPVPGLIDPDQAPHLRYNVRQGRLPLQAGGGPGYVPRYTDWASLLYWGDLASLVPSGSTISMVSVIFGRGENIAGGPATLAAPVMYGHDHSPSNLVVAGQPPRTVAGYGPLRYPGLAHLEEGVLTVPSTWVTAWLAGTITGLGFLSRSPADGIDSYNPAVTDNAHLLITYTPPPEEP